MQCMDKHISTTDKTMLFNMLSCKKCKHRIQTEKQHDGYTSNPGYQIHNKNYSSVSFLQASSFAGNFGRNVWKKTKKTKCCILNKHAYHTLIKNKPKTNKICKI